MRIAAVLLAAALAATAQTPPRRPASPRTPPPKTITDVYLLPIREIVVEGNKNYPAERVIALSGLKIGDLAAKKTFEAASDRITGLGAFETFAWNFKGVPDNSGVSVTLMVTEVEQRLPWAIDRLPVTPQELAARASAEVPLFAERIPTTELYLSHVSACLEKVLAGKGRKERVTARVTLLGRDQITVLFGPPTPPPVITEVRFLGARVMDPRELWKLFSQVALGVPYIEQNFRVLLETQLRGIYDSAGHLRASFPKVEVAPAPTGRGVIVTVTVEEGPQFALTGIKVSGTSLSQQEVEDMTAVRAGQPVNYSEVGKGLDKIKDYMKSLGYLKVSYSGQRRIDEENKTVELLITVYPGPLYKMGSLAIAGLDMESEPAIRKMYAIKEGEPFRDGYPDTFLRLIRERRVLDFLGETKADLKIDDKTATVNVTLTFKGAPGPLGEQPGRRRQR
jgi:outer membrane protein insertion porin family